jgi:hemerythrin
MEDIGYPDLEAHRLQHYNLVEVLSNKMLGLDMGQYEPEEIERFLVSWFVNHVTHEDSQIGVFIRQGD